MTVSSEKKFKSINFQVKQVGEPEERILKFIGSDETQDRDGDIVSVDGWDLSCYKNNPVFLWAHDYSIPPLGKALNVYVEDSKLYFDIQFPEKGIYPFADLVYNLYKGGFLNATSVGFRGRQVTEITDEEAKQGFKGVKFLEQELLELSAVPVPSNPSALHQAKKLGSVTDDEYQSLVSFINGEFVSGANLGAKTMKGIQHVYEAQTKTQNTEEVEEVKGEQNEKNTEEAKTFSFVISSAGKTLLLDNSTGKILGDVTEELKQLISQAVKAVEAKSAPNVQEKAGAAISKQNKSRLSKAKDLILEVLGEVEEQQAIEGQEKDPAVLEDEEELTHPEDTSMDGKVKDPKPEDENPEEEEEEGDDDKDDKKKKSAESDSVIELTGEEDDILEISEEDVSEIVKNALASYVK